MLMCITIFILRYLTFSFEGWAYWLIVLLVIALSLVVFYIWIDEQGKVLERINKMAKSFAQGDLSPHTIITDDDELGDLNESLQLMAGRISSHLKRIEQERDRIQTILASMAEGVLAFDITGRLMLMNKTAEEMLGIKFNKVEGLYFLEILRNHQIADLLTRGLADGKSQVIEVRLSSANTDYYKVYISPIISIDDKNQGAIMVLTNVTKMRILEEMRSEFVANVSHELRTPLTSVKGYVETLLDGAVRDDELSLKFLNIINNEADRLNRLISDLLYLSQLETGRMEVAKREIKAAAFLEKVINLLKPLADAREVALEIVIHKLSPTFFGNEGMMEQVMINLLENAIKYSKRGGVVTVEIYPYENGTALQVKDRGIGIPAESLTRIFERFYRVDKARSRQVGGTGLGLSIVKHIVDRHRGQVHVEAEVNKGTSFTVFLPNN